MRCFWHRGYKQTSMRNLTEAMGISSMSVYNAFGDKRSLYRRALDYYLEHSVRDRIARLTPLPPFSAIRAFFDEIVERSVTDKQRRGCMLVNSALEVAPYDPEFQKLVADEMISLEGFFCRCIVEGQRDGTITSKRPAEELAKVLLSVLLGIRVLAHASAARRAGECHERRALPSEI